MAITLPSSPKPASAVPKVRRFGGDLQGALGGPVQRISRLGTRFAVEVSYPPLTKAQFDALIAAILCADTEQTTVICELPQEALSAGVGSPLVNGASQTGTTLNADAFTASLVLPVGALFSFAAGGRNYLHMIRKAVSANGGGAAALPIAPMLRASPADNAALDFVTPKIEGLVEGEEIAWTVDEAKLYHLSFSIAEAE